MTFTATTIISEIQWPEYIYFTYCYKVEEIILL